ncbi:hypothetical protein CR513_04194, partial [Mucuna pruriens]
MNPSNRVPTKYKCHDSRFEDANGTTSHYNESATINWSRTPSFKTIANPMGNVSAISLRNGREVPQQQPIRSVPLPFPTRTVPARKFEPNEKLLQTFWKVEINIPLLEAIKQIPKYAKFLKELCINKRKKLKGGVEMGRIVLALIKSEQVATVTQPAMPKKCRDFRIVFVPCTIGVCSFADVMLDLINVMLTSIYKSLNFGDMKPTGIIIQLANRSIVHPLGILEDVLVRINKLIFPTDFYMLDMEDETFGKGSTLIFGRPFFMIA